MTSSSGTKLRGSSESAEASVTWEALPLASTDRNRGSVSGTLTRAKYSLPVSGSRISTARLSDSPEMYGNGCAGSTASGVSTGKMSERNSLRRLPRSVSSRSS